MSQQVDNLWEEAHSSLRLASATNDDNIFNNLRFESFFQDLLSSLKSINNKNQYYIYNFYYYTKMYILNLYNLLYEQCRDERGN